MKLKLPERRRFVRVETPLQVDIRSGGRVVNVVTKNISPVGFRCEIDKKFEDAGFLDMVLHLPSDDIEVKIKGRVMWQSKVTLEDGAPFDVGVDMVEIEDGNKTVFLKYLCDLLYGSSYEGRV